MTWQILISIRILIADILHTILFKKAADSPYKLKQQFWIYSFCVILAAGFFLYVKNSTFSYSLLFIVALGIINSLAFFFSLRAINISQSKSAIFAFGDDFIAIILGYIFLNELRFINLNLAIGILLCFLAAPLFIIGSKKSAPEKSQETKKLLILVLGYSSIWGLVVFLMRYFALEGLPLAEFGLGWYFGSWLGAIFFLSRAKEKERHVKLKFRELLNAFGIAIFTWSSILLSFSALKLAPLTVVEPLLFVSAMIFPALIGLFIFKEIKEITVTETIAIITGLAGGVIIALNF